MSELEEEEGYNNMPLDIQVEILKKLPSKSLIKLRSVSKQWKSLIDSPYFILSYGSRHTNRCILSCKHYNPSGIKYFTFIDNDNENCHTFSYQDYDPADPLGRLVECRHHFVVGSSHGLLCLDGLYQRGPTSDKYGRIDIVVLWNPSIRRSVGIQLPKHDWIARFVGDFESSFSMVGFGVCPVTMDPTIVSIKYGKSKSDYRSSIRCIALVFTLTSGAWNNILTTNLYRESIISHDPQVVIDRFIYWVAYEGIDEDYTTYKLVSFDLTAKEFRVINLPDDDRLTLNRPTISNLRGSLVVLEHTTPGCPPGFLWMMTMEGATPSFTRLYTINLPVTNLLGFRKTGEPIIEMQVDDDEQGVTLHVYDPHSQQSHLLWICGDELYSFFMCPYMETLLLLDQLDGYIYSISN